MRIRHPSLITVVLALAAPVALAACGSTAPTLRPLERPVVHLRAAGAFDARRGPATGDTLSAGTGLWSKPPSGYAYQWSDCSVAGRRCSPIAGARSRRYTVRVSDISDTILVTVTASRAGGSASSSSLPTGPVAGVGAPVDCTGGRTFYISFAMGSDARAGTSEATAWKRAPGMRGFSGSYRHRAGDCFIFEGGVSWPAPAFPLLATGSGRPGRDDYYGVNPTWHTGPAFTQPVFDAGGAKISGPLDSFVVVSNRDYVEIDDIAFRGWNASHLTIGFGSCAMIDANSAGGSGDQNIVVDRITVSGFKVDASGDSTHGDCSLVGAYTGSPWAGSSIVANSTFVGDGNSYGRAIYCFGNVENDTFTGLTGNVYPCGHGVVSGNTISDCGYPSFPPGAADVHADAIETLGANGAFYIHDNVISGTGANSRGDECESMFLGNGGETDYVWNNVLYNLQGESPALTQGSVVGRAAYFWNNTIVGGLGATQACLRPGHGDPPITVWQNNLCITAAPHSVDPAAATLSQRGNVLLTPSQAAADGFSAASTAGPYRPAAGRGAASSPAAGAGANLSSRCSGSLAGLCSKTSVAGRVVPAVRPASGAWNAGAY
jgi:hypothetical protein